MTFADRAQGVWTRVRHVTGRALIVTFATLAAVSVVWTQVQIRDQQRQFREAQIQSAARGKDIQESVRILRNATSPETKARSDATLREAIAAIDCSNREALHELVVALVESRVLSLNEALLAKCDPPG